MNEESLIYHFRVPSGGDNYVERAADPYRVDRLLAGGLQGESLHDVLKASRGPVAELAEPAMAKLLAAVQRAFELQPVAPDGSGVNEKAQMRILTEYLRWRVEVKKNIGSRSTSSPATASPCSPCQQRNGMPSGNSGLGRVTSAPPWLAPASPPPPA